MENEFKKADRQDYYIYKKEQLIQAMNDFVATDDLHCLSDMFSIMVAICRTHGLSKKKVDKFFIESQFPQVLTKIEEIGQIINSTDKMV